MLEIRDLHVQFHGADHEAVRGIDLTVCFYIYGKCCLCSSKSTRSYS